LKESVSIIIPVYEEEESLPELYRSTKAVMDGLDIPYEVIFVDDGSKDSSLEILEGIQANDSKVVVLSFRRNFGQTAALAAGFDYAKGDIVVTMDADLQNDPADIPRLLEKIKDSDVVSGWRKTTTAAHLRHTGRRS
jgi:glycosyltransferase involved in cell wall biosynthesis